MNIRSVQWVLMGIMLTHGSGILAASLSAKKNNQLKQVFHHKMAANATPHSIELGSVVLYLAKDPVVEVRGQKNMPNATEYAFFMPQTSLTPEAKKMIEAEKNSFNNDLYRMRISEVPQGGVMVTIVCNTPGVGMRYQLFESIKRDKGIVFSFYNNDLIKTLHKEKPVLRTAQNHKEQRIVVDCGHGGSDVGAIGPTGVQEKEVCLTVGIELASMLRKEGFDVFLTRRNDIFVPLDYRTSSANSSKADLFISIHANSAPNTTARGIETHYLDTGLLHQAFTTLSANASQIVDAIDTKNKLHSELLANTVHASLIAHMTEFMPDIINRKVKKSVSQVLLGTFMPAILIELGFLSNPAEEKRLNTHPYQRELARGICNGVVTYAKNNLPNNVVSL